MSNALNRSKKKMDYGYKKNELHCIYNYSKKQKNTENMLLESHKNLALIAYQILHDKFGFGKKRIIKVEQIINGYLESYAENEISTEQLQFFMREKCGIDVKKESNAVPYRERFFLINRKVSPQYMKTAGIYLNASICNYFALLGVCLKTMFCFSSNKIKEVYEWIRYYINTISRKKEFGLEIRDIAFCLYNECNYCDSRFIKI